MKAILIDPETQTITEVEYSGNYKDIYKLTGCDCFTVVGIEDGNGIFVDDEGLFNDPRYFFLYNGYDQPLAGKGLILGTNEEGDSVDCTLTVDYIREKVKFIELSLMGFDPIPDGTVTPKGHPMGEGIPVTGHTPIFGPPDGDDDYEGQDRESYTDDQDRDNYTR